MILFANINRLRKFQLKSDIQSYTRIVDYDTTLTKEENRAWALRVIKAYKKSNMLVNVKFVNNARRQLLYVSYDQ